MVVNLFVRATDVKNNFGRYLQHAAENGEVIIKKMVDRLQNWFRWGEST